jgi:hypothetical protein
MNGAADAKRAKGAAAPSAEITTDIDVGASNVERRTSNESPVDSIEPTGLFYTELDAKERIAAWRTKGWQQDLRPLSQQRLAELTTEASAVIDAVHESTREKNGGRTLRAQHAKALYATPDAIVRIAANLPSELAHGAFQPGTELRAIVRLSNVRGTVLGDDEPDLRGIAIRMTDDKGRVQDILLNTTPMFFAPDADHTLAGAAARESGIGGILGLAGKVLTGKLSFGDTKRMIQGGLDNRSKDTSVASHTFWSRTPFMLGDHAVKLRLVPADDVSPALASHGPNQLKDDIESRVAAAPVRYRLQVQGFRDKETTPMEDTRVVWDTPFVTVAELTLPRSDGKRAADDVQRVKNEVEHMAFSPFHTWDDKFLEPLGEINAIRKAAYDESAGNRGVDPAKRLRCPLGFG